jgi:hypothetical protein
MCHADAMEIWEAFCADNAPKQVCLPCNIKDKLKAAIDDRKVHVNVFDEAVSKCVRTLIRDTYPRFKRSPENMELQQRLRAAIELPEAALEVRTILDDPKFDVSKKKKYTLDEILQDHYLLSLFIEFLQEQVCQENVMCWRQIQLFLRQYDDDKTNEKSRANAWAIYRMFIEIGSPMEVDCLKTTRTKIGYQLGMPKKNMFDDIVKKCYTSMKLNSYEQFRESEKYKGIPKYLKALQKSRQPGNESATCSIQ